MGDRMMSFGWVDAASTNQAAAKEFYSKLFGWKPEDQPLPDGGFYTTFTMDGKQVAGLGQAFPGMPSVWTSYVMVEDADAIAAKAKDLDGQLMMAPMDVMDVGRMAMISDPTGAPFGIWQGKTHHGAEISGVHGSLSWNELATRGVEKALPFYGQLFGWSWKETPMGPDLTYHVADLGGKQIAGAMNMTEQWPADLPPHWNVYFQVDDADASASAIKDLGGNVIDGPIDVPDVGRMYYAADPTGATFFVMKNA